MTWKQFFRFVELQTKVASQFPFVFGSLYAYYQYGRFDWLAFGLFFIALLCLDMFTTGLNNLYDARRNRLEQGYSPDYQNVLLRDQLSLKWGEIILLGLFLIVLLAGISLVLYTSWLVLVLGVISFGVAILYSYGPVPINHTPFGEIFSGLTMGGLITFLAVFIQTHDLGWISLEQEILRLNIAQLLRIGLVSLPFILITANIMLANNMSDLHHDRQHGRYSLVHYIGLEQAKRLFSLNYLLVYLTIVALVIGRILPVTCLMVLVSLPKVYANVRRFIQRVAKSETFVLSVKNYRLIALLYCLGLGLALVVL